MIKQRSSLPHSVSHFICCGCVGSMRENIFMYNLLIIEKDHVPLPLDLQKSFTLFQLIKSKIKLTKACKHKHTYEQMIVSALYARSKVWGSYVHVPFSIAWVEGNTWLCCYGFLGYHSPLCIYLSRLRLQRKQGFFLSHVSSSDVESQQKWESSFKPTR